MKGFFIFLKNQIKLSIRDMNMPIFAIIMPLVIMAVLGIIYGEKPAFDGVGYTFMEQSFGALCAISICAGGLMGLPMALADLRERKVLKRLWVTPASPALLLGVELALYVFYCAASLVTLWVAAFIWKVKIRGSALTFFGSWLITMFSTLSIGMFVGGIAKKFKASLRYCFRALFPDACFFRSYAADGGYAGIFEKNCRRVSSCTRDYTYEKRVFGNGSRKYIFAHCGNDGSYDYIFRTFGALFSMGVVAAQGYKKLEKVCFE